METSLNNSKIFTKLLNDDLTCSLEFSRSFAVFKSNKYFFVTLISVWDTSGKNLLETWNLFVHICRPPSSEVYSESEHLSWPVSIFLK